MATHPGQLLLLLLLGLCAAAVLVVALYLLMPRRRKVAVVREANGALATRRTTTLPDPAARRRHIVLAAIGVALILWVFAGKFLVSAFFPSGSESPGRPGGPAARLQGASGAELLVVRYGPTEGPALVFTHGWGADRRDWLYAINALPPNLHVVVWDLPGLGESSRPRDDDFSMEKLAADLDRVVTSLQGRPVILVGHSVGGILNLEYARRYPQKLGREVRGIVQANTTYTNPVETKKNAELSRKLQEPVLEPLLHLVSWTSPVARVFGWLAYQSGLAHLQLASQSFAGAETWGQLDQMARYAYRSSPGVVSKGVLAMLRWDGSDVLPRINVPTLIISGDQDVTTLPAASDRMAKDIRSATRVSIGQAAHLGPVEQHRQYADAIARFAQAATVGAGLPVATAAK